MNRNLIDDKPLGKSSLLRHLRFLRKCLSTGWYICIRNPNKIFEAFDKKDQTAGVLDRLAHYSLCANITGIKVEMHGMMIILQESKDGTTNIDIDVLNLIEKMSG